MENPKKATFNPTLRHREMEGINDKVSYVLQRNEE